VRGATPARIAAIGSGDSGRRPPSIAERGIADVELEKRINEMLATLPITRIHVAHRPQTIALADRVIRLGGAIETAMPLQAAE
jgi:hypothetical protein